MKNFKLLLATTAMLSMSAMVSNAANQDTVDVTVEMVSPAYVVTKTDMNLGKIAPRFNADDNTRMAGVLTLNTDGTVSATDMDYYGGASVAVVTASGLMTGRKLAFPDEVAITKGTGEDIQLCGTLKEIVTDGGSSGYGDHHIGGKFYINTDTTIAIGSCTGSFTATAVIDDGQGS